MSDLSKTVFLIRNSDASQDISLESQRDACEQFASDNGLCVLRKIQGLPASVFQNGAFIDESVSGASAEKRRGFQALLRTCENQDLHIHHIVCYDISRFGRFDQDETGYHRHFLKTKGVAVLFVTEGFRGDDSDDLVRSVKQWQGRKYLVDLSQVTQRGDIRLAQKGYWLGGTPPYGYDLLYENAEGRPVFRVRYEPDGSKLVMGPDEAILRIVPRGEELMRSESDRPRLCLSTPDRVNLIVAVFEARASGRGYKSIAEDLNARRIPAIRNGSWSTRHKAGWSHNTVRNILFNLSYLGGLVYNRASSSKFHNIKNLHGIPTSIKVQPANTKKHTKLSQDDWIIAKNSHPAIVTQELWDRAHPQQQSTRRIHGRGVRAEYVFSGLIDCVACSHHYHGHTSKKGKPRNDGSPVLTRDYLCGGYDSKGTAVCPVRYSVGEVQLYDTVIAAIESQYGWLLEDTKFVDAVRNRALEIMARPKAKQCPRSEIELRIREIDQKINALVTSISPENMKLLDSHLTQFRLERQSLSAELAEVTVETGDQHVDEAAIQKAIDRIRENLPTVAKASADLKRRFIRSFVDKIELDPRSRTGTAWLMRIPTSVLDALRTSVRSIAGAGLEPATSGL